MILYQQLRKNRLSRRISQKEIAVATGLSQQYISRIESGKDVTISTMTKYANALGYDLTATENSSLYLPPSIAHSHLVEQYHRLSQNHDIILSHTSALEALSLFSGYLNPVDIHVYTLDSFNEDGVICHRINSSEEVGYTMVKGMKCTDINTSINDVLRDYENTDDTVIYMALNTYYYRHGQSFDGLHIAYDNIDVFNDMASYAIEYC